MSILTPVNCTSCGRLEAKMFGFISRYSPGFTKGTKLSTMHTRRNAKSSTESLRRLRKGARLSLEQGNRRSEDENVVLNTKFSKLDSQTVLRIKEYGGSKDDAFTCRTCTLNVGIRE